MKRMKLPYKIAISIIFLLMLITTIPNDAISTDEEDSTDESMATMGDAPMATNSQLKLVKKIDDVFIQEQWSMPGRSNIAIQGSTIFYAFWQYNGSTMDARLIASYDNGSTWTSPIDVYRRTTTTNSNRMYNALHIWKGEIFYFLQVHDTYAYNRIMLVKKAPVSSWTNLRTASATTVISSEANANYCPVSGKDYLYLAAVQSSQWTVRFYRYSGASWTTIGQLSDPGSTFKAGLTIVDQSGSEKLVLTYTRQYHYEAGKLWSDGKIYMRTSTNSGSTWTSAVAIASKVTDHQAHMLLNLNGTLVLISNRQDYDDLLLYRSTDKGSTWSDGIYVITDRGFNLLGTHWHEWAAGSNDNKTIYLVYEGENGTSSMTHSEDWGANWIDEDDAVQLETSNSLDPFITPDNRFLSMVKMNGTLYDLELYDLKGLYLESYSPVNLTVTSGYFTNNLTWEAPPMKTFDRFTFQGYKIFRGRDQFSLSQYATVGNVTSYLDLVPSYMPAKYYYAVLASFSTIGDSPLSNLASGTPLIPPPPENLISEPGDLMVDLYWDPLPDEVMQLFPIDHYTVYRGRYSDSLHRLADVQGAFSYRDQDIDIYPATYHYKVTYTLQVIGEGNPSNITSAKPNTYPDPPEELGFSEIDGGVRLGWKPPLDNGCCNIIKYRIFRGNHTDEMDLISENPSATRNLDQTGLVIGNNYYYTLTATNRLGESLPTEPLRVNYKGVTSRPRDLTAVGEQGAIDLCWSPPSVTWGLPVESYYIYRGSSSRATALYKTVEGTVTSFTDIVTNGIEYEYEVSAVNVHGESQRAGPVFATASTIPGKVTDITISSGDRSAMLEWEPAEDDGGSPITYYTIYRSQILGEPQKLQDMATGILLLFDSGLNNGETYYYWIRAWNKNGAGPYSDPVSAVPGKTPFMISEISAVPLLFGARLSWKEPMDGGRDILEYRIYRGAGMHSIEYLTNRTHSGSDDPEYTDRDLEYGGTYFYGVKAVNLIGESAFSPIVSVTPFGAPSAPRISGWEHGLNDLRVSWLPPGDSGGLPIAGYSFHFRIQGKSEWVTLETKDLDIAVRSLKAGDVMEVMVSAFNDLIEGPPSDIVEIELGDVPEKMNAPKADPGDSSALLKWELTMDNGHPILGYNIYMVNDKGKSIKIAEAAGDVLQYALEGLLNGRSYQIRISAHNKFGEGPLSDPAVFTPVALPSKPMLLAVDEAEDQHIMIYWTEPGNKGGSELVEYIIFRGTSLQSISALGTVSAEFTYYDDQEVENGKTYYYQISAVNGVGAGPKSQWVSARPLSLPSAPVDLRASATTDTVTVSWLEPADNGGSDIIGYVVYKGKSEDDMELWKQLGPDVTSLDDEDVEEGSYLYMVRAFNEKGMGAEATREVSVPARNPTAAVIGIAAFLIPLLIAILAVIVPLMIVKSKRKREKEAKEAKLQEEAKPAVEQPTPPAGPQLPGAQAQRPGAALALSPPTAMIRSPERQLPPAIAPQPMPASHMQQPPPVQQASTEITYQKPQPPTQQGTIPIPSPMQTPPTQQAILEQQRPPAPDNGT
ncbi:MAG: fibronectin type III domain-containing protein [Thermoplasmatota archaeon]